MHAIDGLIERFCWSRADKWRTQRSSHCREKERVNLIYCSAPTMATTSHCYFLCDVKTSSHFQGSVWMRRKAQPKNRWGSGCRWKWRVAIGYWYWSYCMDQNSLFRRGIDLCIWSNLIVGWKQVTARLSWFSFYWIVSRVKNTNYSITGTVQVCRWNGACNERSEELHVTVKWIERLLYASRYPIISMITATIVLSSLHWIKGRLLSPNESLKIWLANPFD
jgi:hypothetical protein